MKKTGVLLVVSILIISCKAEPSKINYGNDACHYCKMTIVDKTHASEIVTNKGKASKYDAIECMLNDLQDRNKEDIALYLVTDYVNPEKLTDATVATYLISESIQSPMGANLTAFANKADAERNVKNNQDSLFTWEEMKDRFSN